MFFFLQKCLESEAGDLWRKPESPSGAGRGGAGRCGAVRAVRAVFCQVDVVAARLDPADPTLAAFGGGEDVVCAATSS